MKAPTSICITTICLLPVLFLVTSQVTDLLSLPNIFLLSWAQGGDLDHFGEFIHCFWVSSMYPWSIYVNKILLLHILLIFYYRASQLRTQQSGGKITFTLLQIQDLIWRLDWKEWLLGHVCVCVCVCVYVCVCVLLKDKLKVKSLSHVRLFVTSWMVAYHTPLSMGFSRQKGNDSLDTCVYVCAVKR